MKQEILKELIWLAFESKSEWKLSETPFKVWQKYFCRTVTYHCVWEVEAITWWFIIWKKDTYTWVADSWRFQQAINEWKLDEIEPVDWQAFTSISSIVDVFEWSHSLPRTQK